jgi:hypothetical protein
MCAWLMLVFQQSMLIQPVKKYTDCMELMVQCLPRAAERKFLAFMEPIVLSTQTQKPGISTTLSQFSPVNIFAKNFQEPFYPPIYA